MALALLYSALGRGDKVVVGLLSPDINLTCFGLQGVHVLRFFVFFLKFVHNAQGLEVSFSSKKLKPGFTVVYHFRYGHIKSVIVLNLMTLN